MIGRWSARVVAIAGRELLSLFVTPVAYVVGTLFLLLQGWDFALLLRVLNDPLAAPGPVMQYYFGGSFFIFWLPVVFLCAAASMRLIAEERRHGTLEALLTAPVTPAQIVVGKYLGVVVFYVSLWVPTAVFYVLLRGAAVTPDPGPVLAGYLGTFVVGCSFLAIGLLASVVSRTQLGAAIVTLVLCTLVVLAGLLVDQVESPWLARLLERTSLLAMMQELAQGIVDTRWLWVHGALVVTSLTAATILLDPRRDRERFVQLGFVAVTAVYLAAFGVRHAARHDWTGGKVYSLSSRAVELLGTIDEPIDVRVLVPSTLGAGRLNPVAQELREVLARMQEVAPELRVGLVDPDRDRQEAEQLVRDFGLSGRELADGVVLIRAGQGSGLRRAHLFPDEIVTFATGPDVQATGPRVQAFRGEEALLSAFVKVTDPRRIVVCVTQGHGEPSLDSFEPYSGYAHLQELLENIGMEVRTADLQTAGGLTDCGVVLVAGPRGPLHAREVDAIERFVADGGELMLLAGAVVLRGREGLAQTGLEPLVLRFGIELGDRVVLDPRPMAGGSRWLAFTLEDGWGDHPAVRSLIGRPVSFVLVRELALDEEFEGRPQVLLQTGEGSWAESDVAGLLAGTVPTADEGVDRPGPIPIAVAAARAGSRLVVLGSDQLVLNAHLREEVAYDHTRDLIVNAVAWLVDRDILLGIRSREREHVKLVLLPDQLRRMTIVCLVGLPAFTIGAGLLVLWTRTPVRAKRRKRMRGRDGDEGRPDSSVTVDGREASPGDDR